MTDPTPLPIPPPETVWPPAPLHGAAPPSLFISADGIEVTQSGGRLVVINNFARRAYLAQTFAFLFALSSPWITYWQNPYHHAARPALLPFVFSAYQSGCWIYLSLLLFLIVGWCLFTLYLGRGIVVMDTTTKTVNAGGRTRSLNEIASVQTNKWQADALGRQYVVQIFWKDDTLRPYWYSVIMWVGAKSSILGAFRQEANAEKVAAAVAEFAGVSVQHRTH